MPDLPVIGQSVDPKVHTPEQVLANLIILCVNAVRMTPDASKLSEEQIRLAGLNSAALIIRSLNPHAKDKWNGALNVWRFMTREEVVVGLSRRVWDDAGKRLGLDVESEEGAAGN